MICGADARLATQRQEAVASGRLDQEEGAAEEDEEVYGEDDLLPADVVEALAQRAR